MSVLSRREEQIERRHAHAMALTVIHQQFGALPPHIDHDDLIQVAKLRMQERPYNPERGAWKAWAYYACLQGIIDYLRHERFSGARGGHEDAVPIDDLGLVAGERTDEVAITNVTLYEALRALQAPKHRLTVRLYYLEGVSQDTIGAQLGVSGSRVSQLLSEARTVMRDAVG